MQKFKYIFIILVYRNTNDLEDCLISIKSNVQSFKVIVINAFYDRDTYDNCYQIAKKYDCDFINIENKGYSYGNNRGIEYAKENYDYDYIIISNPDIEIIDFDDSALNHKRIFDIFAPRIITLKNNLQNPMAVRRNKIAEAIEYRGFKHNSKLLVLCGIAISKISRKIFSIIPQLYGRSQYPIYCAHGSFVILSRKAITTLQPVYDERMFLFGEEGVLALKAQKAGIKTCYYDLIHIKHKEDGSMKLSDLSINSILAESNKYYYETYVQNL